MGSRHGKQFLYGLFYIGVVLVVGFFVYFVVRILFPAPPTVPPCTSNCVPTDASPIATSSVWSFVSAPGHYTFLAQLANEDFNYAASYLSYAIQLYDASGTVLQSFPGTSFIYAGQTKYLVVPNATVQSSFVHAGIVIAGTPSWQTSSSLGVLPDFTPVNIAYGSNSSTVSVSGQLTNSNLADTRYVLVDVIFYGPDGGPAGASQTVLNNVAPGETVNFSVSYPQTTGINLPASRILVYGLK